MIYIVSTPSTPDEKKSRLRGYLAEHTKAGKNWAQYELQPNEKALNPICHFHKPKMDKSPVRSAVSSRPKLSEEVSFREDTDHVGDALAVAQNLKLTPAQASRVAFRVGLAVIKELQEENVL